MLAALAGAGDRDSRALACSELRAMSAWRRPIGFSGWVGTTLLGVILWRRGWLHLDRAAARRLPRIIAATIVMAGAIVGGQELLAALSTALRPPAFARIGIWRSW